MKKQLYQTIEIPEGIEVAIEGNVFKVKGPQGESEREFNLYRLEVSKVENKIKIGAKQATKTEKKMMNTIVAHLKNMFGGLNEKFEYKLKVCSSHFPISVEVKDDKAIIKNFLGEKIPRECSIPKDTEIKVKGDQIVVMSVNKESAGQAAANFELATKVGKRDKRVFQDGIYIINKAGKEIK